MITLSLKVGSSTLTGLTFSTGVNQVDTVEIMLSNLNSLASQFTHMLMEDNIDQQLVYASMTENFAIDQTVSLILQADNVDDVSSNLSKFLGIKSVIVELL